MNHPTGSPDAVLRQLDRLRAAAVEGLHYAASSYDRDRYQLVLEAVSGLYGGHLALASDAVRTRLIGELGCCTPKLGVNVAVLSTTRQLLVLRRADDDTWCLPCGWVTVGESAEQAARRETAEETGLTIQLRGVVDIMEKLPGCSSTLHHQLNLLFASAPIDQCAITLSAEHVESAWVSDTRDRAWHPGHRVHAEQALRLDDNAAALMHVRRYSMP